MATAQQVPDILSSEFAENPYPAYRMMRESAPLIWHEATQSYIISRYEDVERTFKDRESVFTTDNYNWQIEPVHGKTILQLSGREHAVRRALVAPAFRSSDLQEKFLPVIDRNARELIDTFRTAGSVDLVADFATRFPVNVIADMLGLDKTDHVKFHGWYTAVIAFLGNLSGDAAVTAAGERTRVEFAEYMIPIIRDRRDNLGDDLLSTLCSAEVDGVRMSDEDIKAFCSLLLAAGGETTDKAIASIFANLLLHPEQLAAVREDRSLIARAFAETLRYTPPGGEVTLAGSIEGTMAKIEVRDTGAGIEPRDLEHIFERFTRGDAGLTQRVGGTGLGLAISKSLIELHGGSIAVDSTVGEGSAFRVRLPVPAAAAAWEPSRETAEAVHQEVIKIQNPAKETGIKDEEQKEPKMKKSSK